MPGSQLYIQSQCFACGPAFFACNKNSQLHISATPIQTLQLLSMGAIFSLPDEPPSAIQLINIQLKDINSGKTWTVGVAPPATEQTIRDAVRTQHPAGELTTRGFAFITELGEPPAFGSGKDVTIELL